MVRALLSPLAFLSTFVFFILSAAHADSGFLSGCKVFQIDSRSSVVSFSCNENVRMVGVGQFIGEYRLEEISPYQLVLSGPEGTAVIWRVSAGGSKQDIKFLEALPVNGASYSEQWDVAGTNIND